MLESTTVPPQAHSLSWGGQQKYTSTNRCGAVTNQMADNSQSTTIRYLTLVVVLTVALAASVAITGAAAAEGADPVPSVVSDTTPAVEANSDTTNETHVTLDPVSTELGPGGTTTYDVVLTNADGGVGTFDKINVTINDTSVATIDSASTPISVASATVESDARASFVATFGGDTANSGDVRLGSVTVSAAGVGSTDLNVSLAGDIYKESGRIYEIDAIQDGTLTVTRPPSEVVTTPQSNTALTSSTVTYDVVLTDANGGVGTFDEIYVDVSNSSVVTVESVSTSITGASGTVESGTRASLNASFGGDTVNSGNVTLGSVKLAGNAPGSTNLTLTLTGEIFDEDGQPYNISATRDAVVTAKQPPTIGGNEANDTDGDGKIDDLNGNGESDRGDAQALFASLNSSDVTENTELLDYNNNGKVDRGDVQALFSQAS